MKIVKIIFKDGEDVLGCIKHTNIVEALIPSFKESTHDMFLRHVFVSREAIDSWQILSVEVDNESVVINLKGMNRVSSLLDFATSQNKKPDAYLKAFHIVEVDFGFYSDVFSIHGTIKKNSKYTDAILPGELHKRRPCILLNVKNGRAQVIPLSTKTTVGHDPKNIPLSKASFAKLAARYSAVQSYALLGMIQTVSVNRIFPPRNSSGKVEHKYQLYSIATVDRNALKSALAQQYNHGLVYQNEQLKQNLAKLSQEKMKILGSNQHLKSELQEVKSTVDELKRFIIKFGKDLGAGDTFEKIIGYYDNE